MKKLLRQSLLTISLGILAVPVLAQDTYHRIFRGQLAQVDAERAIYERGKDRDCLIAIRITNVAGRAIGIDLRKYWNVIYPNSWGFSATTQPGIIDEKRIIRKPMSFEEKRQLIVDYANKLLTIIPSGGSITYFREFTIGRNIRKEIDSATQPYLIIGLDGVLRVTNGETAEEVFFPDDGSHDADRWLAIRLPTTWKAIPENSLLLGAP